MNYYLNQEPHDMRNWYAVLLCAITEMSSEDALRAMGIAPAPPAGTGSRGEYKRVMNSVAPIVVKRMLAGDKRPRIADDLGINSRTVAKIMQQYREGKPIEEIGSYKRTSKQKG